MDSKVVEEFEKVKDKILAYAIFKLSTDGTQFVVDKVSDDHDWDTFLEDFSETEPRFAA